MAYASNFFQREPTALKVLSPKNRLFQAVKIDAHDFTTFAPGVGKLIKDSKLSIIKVNNMKFNT